MLVRHFSLMANLEQEILIRIKERKEKFGLSLPAIRKRQTEAPATKASMLNLRKFPERTESSNHYSESFSVCVSASGRSLNCTF